MDLPSSFQRPNDPAAYDRELETERPFLIVRGDLLSSEEKEAIKRYLDRHPTFYHTVSAPGGEVSRRARSDPWVGHTCRAGCGLGLPFRRWKKRLLYRSLISSGFIDFFGKNDRRVKKVYDGE